MESYEGVILPLVLSAGHNPSAKGARALGYVEHDLTCLMVGLMTEEFEAMGIPIIIVDPMMKLQERIDWVLKNHPKSLALEVHFNTFNGAAEGTEVFYKAGDMIGFNYGRRFLSNVSKELNLKNRGMKLASASARGSLAWTSKLNHGLLWEVCFMDNPEDLGKILPLGGIISKVCVSHRRALISSPS